MKRESGVEMMKGTWKHLERKGAGRAFAIILAALLLAGGITSFDGPVPGAVSYAKSTVKLRTKKGKIYGYVNGKKIKNKWKTIGKYRYYFGKKGAAATESAKIGKAYYVFDAKGRLCRPSGTGVVTVNKKKYRVAKNGKAAPGWQGSHYYGTTGLQVKNGWSADKNYYLNAKGLKVTGITAITTQGVDDLGLPTQVKKLYAFGRNGKKDGAKTAKLQKACTYEKKFSVLKALIGEPKSKTYRKGCYDGPLVNGKYPYKGGKDGILKYSGFTVNTYRAPDGTEFFLSLS